MDALEIERAIVGGCDWGARTANIVAALWPERCKALVSVSGYLIGSQEANKLPLPPEAELAWWYQYYFATERGRAGYEQYRREFARLIWQTRLAAVGLRRRHVRAQRGGLRQSRSRRHRDPQLPLAARAGRRRAAVRRSGKAACRGPDHRRAHHHPRRRRQRRAAPGPQRLRQEVLGQVRAPDHHRRHRAQPAPGGPAGLCPSRRSTSTATDPAGRSCGSCTAPVRPF